MGHKCRMQNDADPESTSSHGLVPLNKKRGAVGVE